MNISSGLNNQFFTANVSAASQGVSGRTSAQPAGALSLPGESVNASLPAAQVNSRSAPSPLSPLNATNAPSQIDSVKTSTTDDALGEREERVKQQAEQKQELQELRLIQDQVAELSARDREVRAHEQAHAAVGGQYAGAPRYTFEQGPDGVNYAVGGEVSIDVSPAGTPAQTIEKAQTVRRAALAPAEPSPQDRKVAALASALEQQARAELIDQNAQEQSETLSPSQSTEDTEASQASAASVSSARSSGTTSPIEGEPQDATAQTVGSESNARVADSGASPSINNRSQNEFISTLTAIQSNIFSQSSFSALV